MRSKVPRIYLLVFSLTFSMVIFHYVTLVSAKPNLPVRNIDTGFDYTTIQEAIDASETLDGHTIFVRNGRYYERVVLRKDLSLIGEDKNTTIIDANGNGPVIRIENISYSRVSGFTIRNSGRWYSHLTFPESTGIYVVNSRGVVLDRNIVKTTEYGIYFANSSNSVVYNNMLTANDDYDIYLHQSNSITVCGNSILDSLGRSGILVKSSVHNIIDRNTISLGFGNAITLEDSYENIVESNWLSDKSWDGIDLYKSCNNIIVGNTIENNWRGIILHDARDNKIYHNSLIDNKDTTGIMRQIVIYGSNNTNIWDDSLGKGSYWSDYGGQDLDNDGIGDVPYVIDQENQDNYPLMNPSIIPPKKMQSLYYELLSSYDYLQTNYNNLRLEQEHIINELNTIRCLMYILMTTTIIFAVTTVYLIARKPKVKPEVKTN